MGTSKKWLCETDPTAVKTTRHHRSASLPRRTSSSIEEKEDNGEMLNADSGHSAQSKQTVATVGETSATASNTSSCCRPDNPSWSMTCLVPTDTNQHERFFDSFILCNEDGGANAWWEDLESPFKAPRESTSRPSTQCKDKLPSERTKSSSKSPSKSSRSSSKSSPISSSSRQRDVTPRSPTRKSSGRASAEKDRAPRNDGRESRSQRRTSSKSPAKSRKERPEYRKCLSHSSIKDTPSIELAGPSASMLNQEPKKVPVPRSKSHWGSTTRSSVSPPRGVTKTAVETEPVAKSVPTKRRDYPSSRLGVSNVERKNSITRTSSIPRREPRTESSSRPSRNLSPNRTERVKSPTPTRVRVVSPVRTRSEAVDESMLLEAGRTSPKKSKSAPVKGSRHTKNSSRNVRSATTSSKSACPDHQMTKEDVLDFIAAQIRHLEETTDLAIEFTVRRPEDHRRASLDAIGSTPNNTIKEHRRASLDNGAIGTTPNKTISNSTSKNTKHITASDGSAQQYSPVEPNAEQDRNSHHLH